MADLGHDFNYDDALLTLAKNKKEIKLKKETGWDEGEKNACNECLRYL